MGWLLSATRVCLGELHLSDLLSGDDPEALGQLTALDFGVEPTASTNVRFVASPFATRPLCKSPFLCKGEKAAQWMALEAAVRLVLLAEAPSATAPPCPKCGITSWTTVVRGFADGMSPDQPRTTPIVEARCSICQSGLSPTVLCLLCNVPYVAAASKIGPARAKHVGTGCKEKRGAMTADPACGFLKGSYLCTNSEPSEGEL